MRNMCQIGFFQTIPRATCCVRDFQLHALSCRVKFIWPFSEKHIYIWYFDPNINLFACFWVQFAILLSYCGQRLRPCGLLEGFKRSFMSRTAFCRKRNEFCRSHIPSASWWKRHCEDIQFNKQSWGACSWTTLVATLYKRVTSELMFHPPFLKWKHVFFKTGTDSLMNMKNFVGAFWSLFVIL